MGVRIIRIVILRFGNLPISPKLRKNKNGLGSKYSMFIIYWIYIVFNNWRLS